MTLATTAELNFRNQAAWDQLYASTPELIWGRDPIAFLPQVLAHLSALPSTGGVLDAATGEGRNLEPLLALGRPVTACDSSSAALAKIPAVSRARTTTLTCDLAHIPLPDAQFAFILLSDVVETLPQPAPVLAELRRLLVPGGLLLANFPALDDGVANIDMQPVDDGGWLYQGRYFYRFYTRQEAERLVAQASLELVQETPFSWQEAPHPHFRAADHHHRSHVLLVRRSP